MQRSSVNSVFDDAITEGGSEVGSTSKGELSEPVPSSNSQLVASVCHFLEALLSEAGGWGFPKAEPVIAEKRKILTSYFAFAYAWGLGGGLSEESREKVRAISQAR